MGLGEEGWLFGVGGGRGGGGECDVYAAQHFIRSSVVGIVIACNNVTGVIRRSRRLQEKLGITEIVLVV